MGQCSDELGEDSVDTIAIGCGQTETDDGRGLSDNTDYVHVIARAEETTENFWNEQLENGGLVAAQADGNGDVERTNEVVEVEVGDGVGEIEIGNDAGEIETGEDVGEIETGEGVGEIETSNDVGEIETSLNGGVKIETSDGSVEIETSEDV